MGFLKNANSCNYETVNFIQIGDFWRFCRDSRKKVATGMKISFSFFFVILNNFLFAFGWLFLLCNVFTKKVKCIDGTSLQCRTASCCFQKRVNSRYLNVHHWSFNGGFNGCFYRETTFWIRSPKYNAITVFDMKIRYYSST